jgi:hypothetical protein
VLKLRESAKIERFDEQPAAPKAEAPKGQPAKK